METPQFQKVIIVFLLYNTVPICIARVWVLKTLLQYILATWETSCVQSVWFVVLINFIPFKPNSPTMVNFMKKMIPPNFWFLNYHSTFPIHQGINFLTQNGTVRVRHWNSIRWELHFFRVRKYIIPHFNNMKSLLINIDAVVPWFLIYMFQSQSPR